MIKAARFDPRGEQARPKWKFQVVRRLNYLGYSERGGLSPCGSCPLEPIRNELRVSL